VLAAAIGLALGVLGVATAATASRSSDAPAPAGIVAAVQVPVEHLAPVAAANAVLPPAPQPVSARPLPDPAPPQSRTSHAAWAPTGRSPAPPRPVATPAPFDPAGI
jgi:hypothetical protein